ncbi:MAG: biotin--[acetyl-CoA-carboxylase] ligase [Planctomycetota bacterium]
MSQKLGLDRSACPLGRRAIESLLQAEDPVLNSARHDRVATSTNSLAISELRDSELQDGHADDSLSETDYPRLILADEQSDGRGRSGKTWMSDQGTLTFTLVIQHAEDLPGMPLAVGVGLAHAIEFEFAPLKVHLKWPNDLIVGGAKLGGVLCESVQSTARFGAQRYVAIGIGVNVATEPALDSDDTNTSISLGRHIGRPLQRYDILPHLIHGVLESVERLAEDPKSIGDDFRRHCCLTGHAVAYREGDVMQAAECLGIDDQGALLMRNGGRIIRRTSGEINRIRQA